MKPGPKKRDMPADFLERYAVSTRGQLLLHYGMSASACDRFGKVVPADVRAAHAAVCHAARCASRKVHLEKITRAKRRPLPDDFSEHFRCMTKSALVRHYTAGMSTVTKWCNAMNATDTLVHDMHVAAVLVRSQAAAVASAKANRDANPKPPKPPKPAKSAPTQRLARMGKPMTGLIPEAKADIVSMAMRHLMPTYSPVCRAEVFYSSPIAKSRVAGQFKVGRMTMNETELMALAAKRGFTVSAGFAG